MRTLALALAFTALLGCGYRTGMVVAETDEAIGVEFFGNDSLQPDLERDFHPFVTDALNRMVHAPLVSPDRSDLVVRGRLLEYSGTAGIRSVDNELLEVGLRVTVEAQLVRRSRDSDGTWREEVLESGLYGSEGGYRFEEPQGELRARDRVFRNIADRLVLDLFGPLAYRTAH